MIVSPDGHLKMIDFGGAWIDGEEGTARYEWFSYRPSAPEVSVPIEIFAYGCFLYELETGSPPYDELMSSTNSSRTVRQLYQDNQFPDVNPLTFGEIIWKCWHGNYESMSDVVRALGKLLNRRDAAIFALIDFFVSCKRRSPEMIGYVFDVLIQKTQSIQRLRKPRGIKT